VAVVNAGSSSLKLAVLDEADSTVASEHVDAPEGAVPADRLAGFLQRIDPVDAVAHRVVHGGSRYREPTVIDEDVLDTLRDLEALAPLHNRPAVRAIETVRAVAPEVPAVACFDTAFHATLGRAASTYAVPAPWTQEWGVRRYGFHGLSHAWATRRASELLGSMPRRLVTCHLGAGASLAAVVEGRSVDTTMGFTPLEGLVMANRSGSVDPGAILWVQQTKGLSAAEVEEQLTHASGLLGLAGSADLRVVLADAATGDEAAVLAVDVYVHRLVREIGAMVASAGGLDALVFTGGVGEHAGEIRRRCFERLAHLDAHIDVTANEGHVGGDGDLTGAGSGVHVLVVEAREDLEMARQARKLLART
jgi:acetate kinase